MSVGRLVRDVASDSLLRTGTVVWQVGPEGEIVTPPEVCVAPEPVRPVASYGLR